MALLLVALPVRSAAAAGFDCTQATTGREHLICSTPALSDADTALTALYRHQLALLSQAARPTLVADQLAWLGTLDSACSATGPDGQATRMASCLKAAYDSRMDALHTLVVQHGPFLFFQVNRKLSGRVQGVDLTSTASYPQIDRAADPATRRWNAAQVIAPERTSPCGGGTMADVVVVTFATIELVNTTRNSSFYCPGTAHGTDIVQQETMLLRPSLHRMTPGDLFSPETSWKQYLADLVEDGVEHEAGVTHDDPGRLSIDTTRSAAIDPQHWSFGETGLTVSFDSYELNMGRGFTPQILIPWTRLKPFLNPELGLATGSSFAPG